MSELTVFAFESTAVRTLTREGNPWFVAVDIANVLGYRDAAHMVRMLDEDEAATHIVGSRSANGAHQNREVIIINESGMWACVLKSRRPEAHAVRKWLTSEVLPSLRKQGSYTMPGAEGVEPGPFVTGNPAHAADQIVAAERVFRSVLRACRTAGLPMPHAIRRANDVGRERTGLDMLQEIGGDDFVHALPPADRTVTAAHAFCDAWLAGATPLPVVPALSRDFFAAYVLWCADAGHATFAMPRFIREIRFRTDVICRRARHMGVGKQVFISGFVIPDTERMPPPDITQVQWLTPRAQQFKQALRQWRAKEDVNEPA